MESSFFVNFCGISHFSWNKFLYYILLYWFFAAKFSSGPLPRYNKFAFQYINFQEALNNICSIIKNWGTFIRKKENSIYIFKKKKRHRKQQKKKSLHSVAFYSLQTGLFWSIKFDGAFLPLFRFIHLQTGRGGWGVGKSKNFSPEMRRMSGHPETTSPRRNGR